MRKLIVNADDFGQSDGINQGIIKAHENGILTSASLMVRYPAAVAAAEYAKGNSTLGIGLHLDLGEWIFRNGAWENLYEVVDLEDVDGVRKEVKTQLKKFYKLMGIKPTHIDSHQHVHQRDGILPIIMEEARLLNVSLRGMNPDVQYCGDFYGQNSDGSAYHEAICVAGLKKTLTALPVGITELACHPGLNDDVETMYRVEREIEVNTLCDPSIIELLKMEQIELISFNRIQLDKNIKA